MSSANANADAIAEPDVHSYSPAGSNQCSDGRSDRGCGRNADGHFSSAHVNSGAGVHGYADFSGPRAGASRYADRRANAACNRDTDRRTYAAGNRDTDRRTHAATHVRADPRGYCSPHLHPGTHGDAQPSPDPARNVDPHPVSDTSQYPQTHADVYPATDPAAKQLSGSRNSADSALARPFRPKTR